MIWTPQRIAILRREYGNGKTAREIGDMVDRSRNAVIGKAHRLGLRMTEESWRSNMSRAQRKRWGERQPAPRACQWLEGEPRERDFCGAPVIASASYCEAHYRRSIDRSREAA